MKTWSFYRASDGLFTGQQFGSSTGNPNDVIANTPDGCRSIEGAFDPDRHCVDIVTGSVSVRRPPAPDARHEWDPIRNRWIAPLAERQAAAADRSAREAIDATELGSLRAMREALLAELPTDSPLRLRLQQIDDAIAAQRPKLTRG